MAEITTKPAPVVKTGLTRQQRAAIEAFGQFVITIEEAFPQEVADTSNASKSITRSGLQMTERPTHTHHRVMRRQFIDSYEDAAACSASGGCRARYGGARRAGAFRCVATGLSKGGLTSGV